MATSSKKTTTKPAANTTAGKKPAARKIVVADPASKATTKKAVTTPTKKTATVTTKKTVETPAKKVSSLKTEKPAIKQATTKDIAPDMSIQTRTVTPEYRHHMIATAAYFHAQQRGFASGHELDDWICSEIRIDAMLDN